LSHGLDGTGQNTPVRTGNACDMCNIRRASPD
jgi:hypothetical protein